VARKFLLGGLALLAAVAVGVAVLVLRPSDMPRSEVPAGIRAQLDAKAAEIAVELQQGGWCVSWATSCELHCEANVFALDPRSARTVAQVTAAYAELSCSDVHSASIDTSSVDVVAMTFGSTPTMRTAPDDATQRDIARLFPVHARAAAWWHYTNP